MNYNTRNNNIISIKNAVTLTLCHLVTAFQKIQNKNKPTKLKVITQKLDQVFSLIELILELRAALLHLNE
jgi:hypothetical protein